MGKYIVLFLILQDLLKLHVCKLVKTLLMALYLNTGDPSTSKLFMILLIKCVDEVDFH